MHSHTSLGRRREEPDFDFLFPQFISILDHRVPGSFVDCLLVLLQVVQKMDLASRIHGDLVPRPNRETGVVVRSEVHDTLARRGISLFVKRARERDLSTRRYSLREIAGGELPCDRGRDVDRRRLCSRSELGVDHAPSRGAKAMLDVRASKRFGMVRLNVEYLLNLQIEC